jgi:carbon monoxide dehydrogenase subunit G
MKVAGTHVLHAPPDRVWGALRDPDVLALTVPGCRDVARTADGEYRIRGDLTVASVAGTCDGRIQVTDREGADACTVQVTASGEPGTIAGTTTVRVLADGPDRARVHYDVDVEIGGPAGAVGQRVLAGVAQRNAAQFFEAIDRYLASEASERELPPLLGDVTGPAPSRARKPLLAGLVAAVLVAFVVVFVRRKDPA